MRPIFTATLLISLGLGVMNLAGAQEPNNEAPQELQEFVGAPPPSFASADELVEAFRQALAVGDKAKLAALLGLAPDKVMQSKEIESSFPEIRDAAAQSINVKEVAPDRRLLLLGGKVWPFPFPVVNAGGKWAFNTPDGLEEVVNRRIGENELTTVATMRAYVDAQEEYRRTDWNGDGVAEYAQKLVSSPGSHDGLYWESGDGEPESPGGPLVNEEELATAAEDGYFGYRYRILTGQGDNVAGGRYDYIINGHMIAGFGLIATPARYDGTGVMTFVVNQNGTVYQKDLGPDSAALAAKITSFDPDDSWTIVSDPGD